MWTQSGPTVHDFNFVIIAVSIYAIDIYINTLFGFLSTIFYEQWFLYLYIPHGALYKPLVMVWTWLASIVFHVTNYTHVAFMTILKQIHVFSYFLYKPWTLHFSWVTWDPFVDKEATVWTEFALHVDQGSWIVITQTVSFKDWSLCFSMLVFALLWLSNFSLKTAILLNFTAIVAGCSIHCVYSI